MIDFPAILVSSGAPEALDPNQPSEAPFAEPRAETGPPDIIQIRHFRGSEMNSLEQVTPAQQTRVLGMSTVAFTVCFAVWTIFSIIGVQIKKDLGLNDTQFGLLVGTPILTGSLVRLLLGVWTDQYGGRIMFVLVMLSAAVATWLLTFAYDYPTFLLAALGVGIAGGSFAVGIAYVSKWYPKERQGTALGIFGAGNVGAAVTKFLAPMIMVAFGWEMVAQVWAGLGGRARRHGDRLLVHHL